MSDTSEILLGNRINTLEWEVHNYSKEAGRLRQQTRHIIDSMRSKIVLEGWDDSNEAFPLVTELLTQLEEMIADE